MCRPAAFPPDVPHMGLTPQVHHFTGGEQQGFHTKECQQQVHELKSRVAGQSTCRIGSINWNWVGGSRWWFGGVGPGLSLSGWLAGLSSARLMHAAAACRVPQ